MGDLVPDVPTLGRRWRVPGRLVQGVDQGVKRSLLGGQVVDDGVVHSALLSCPWWALFPDALSVGGQPSVIRT